MVSSVFLRMYSRAAKLRVALSGRRLSVPS